MEEPLDDAWREIPPEEPAKEKKLEPCGRDRWRYNADDNRYVIDGPLTRPGMKVQVAILEDDAVVVSSTVTLASAGSRKHYAAEAVQAVASKEAIEGHLLEIYVALKNLKEQQEDPRPEKLSPEAKQEAEAFLASHDLIEQIDRDLAALGIVGERNLRLAVYIAATSRKLLRPLALSIVGSSSSGKSHVLQIVASLLPASDVNIATTRSRESLYYISRDSLRHAFVVTKEFDPEDEGSLAMRELLSAGKLSKDIPVRDPSTGEFKTKKIEVEGPIAYCDSTTKLFRYEEDQTRILKVYTDESEHQTERIHDAQRTAATLRGVKQDLAADSIRRRHVAAQCLLETEGVIFRVTVPFAHAIDFPTDRVEYRRRLPHFLTAIQAIALLRQRQREVKEETEAGHTLRHLEATLEDYETAREIFGPFIEQAFKDLDRKGEEALEKITANLRGETFHASEVRRWLRVGKTQTSDRLQALVDAGRVEVREPSKGPRPAVYALTGAPTAVVASLPTVEEIAALLSNRDEEELP